MSDNDSPFLPPNTKNGLAAMDQQMSEVRDLVANGDLLARLVIRNNDGQPLVVILSHPHLSPPGTLNMLYTAIEHLAEQ